MAIAHGIGIGWCSPTMRRLQTDYDSPVDFPVTVREISWIGSALGLGATTGNILVGTFIHRVGNKWCLLFIAIPHTVSSMNWKEGAYQNSKLLSVPVDFGVFWQFGGIPDHWTLSSGHIEWRHVHCSPHVH